MGKSGSSAANGLLMTEEVTTGATEVATKTITAQSTSGTGSYLGNLWNQAKDYYKKNVLSSYD